MRIDRYVHDERLTWGAASVLVFVTGLHAAGIGGLLLHRPSPTAATLPPVFQVSLERLPPPRLPPVAEQEPVPSSVDDSVKTAPRKTRPVPILVDTPTTNPVPPDTQVKPYEIGDELREGEPGPASPPGAEVGGTGEGPAAPPPEAPGKWKVQLVKMKPPEYPPWCLRRGIEGQVKVRVLVGEDGLPQELTIAKSSGDSALDNAALDAVKQWVFVPATRHGVPVRGWAIVPIEFKLLR